jgi:hypothetical protein
MRAPRFPICMRQLHLDFARSNSVLTISCRRSDRRQTIETFSSPRNQNTRWMQLSSGAGPDSNLPAHRDVQRLLRAPQLPARRRQPHLLFAECNSVMTFSCGRSDRRQAIEIFVGRNCHRRLERDESWLSQRCALAFYLSKIFSDNRFHPGSSPGRAFSGSCSSPAPNRRANSRGEDYYGFLRRRPVGDGLAHFIGHVRPIHNLTSAAGRPKLEIGNTGGEVETGLAGDRERLQRDGAIRAADQRIGAEANRNGRLRRISNFNIRRIIFPATKRADLTDRMRGHHG